MKQTNQLKDLLISLLGLVGLCFIVMACSNEEMVAPDEPPFSMYIEVYGSAGNDLLNPDTKGNIIGNPIKVIYRNRIYSNEKFDLTGNDYSSMFALNIMDGKYYLRFGGFLRSQCAFETVVIDWGDGTKDVISFDATNPLMPFYINGKMSETNSFIIIIK